MNLKQVALSLLLAGFAITSTALAGPRVKEVNARRANQHNRIQQGVKKGSLNQAELNKLRSEGRVIRAEEKAMRKSGGHLTKQEQHVLNRQLNKRSQQIHKYKHN